MCREPLEEGKWVTDPRLLSAQAQQMVQRLQEQQQGAADADAAGGQAAEAG